jgi:hypothetical protein
LIVPNGCAGCTKIYREKASGARGVGDKRGLTLGELHTTATPKAVP